MKKIEEVKKHLSECGYTPDASGKIFRFLIDVRLLDEKGAELEGMHGDGEFEDFVNWFYRVDVKEELDDETKKLKDNVEQLKEVINKLDKKHPLYELMKGLGDSMVEFAEQALNESEEEDDNEMDLFEIDCHEALDNIFAALYEGKMSAKEEKSVIDALNVLIVLGNEYEG
jgi:hypothetical protein